MNFRGETRDEVNFFFFFLALTRSKCFTTLQTESRQFGYLMTKKPLTFSRDQLIFLNQALGTFHLMTKTKKIQNGMKWFGTFLGNVYRKSDNFKFSKANYSTKNPEISG